MNTDKLKIKSNKNDLDKLSTLVFEKIYGFTDNLTDVDCLQLREISTLKSGSNIRKSELTDHGKYPVYGGNGIVGFRNDFMFREKRLVIGRVGKYCGNIHITEPYSSITSNAFMLEIQDESFSVYYIKKCLEFRQLNKYRVGETIPYLKGRDILDTPIPIVSESLHQKFSGLQKSIEEIKSLIDNRDELINNLNFINKFNIN